MNLSSELLLAIAAIITAVVAVARSFTQNRAEVVKGYDSLVDDYRQQVKEVKADNLTLKERIAALEQKAKEDKKHVLKIEWQLSQALERISVLEGENETLRGRIT